MSTIVLVGLFFTCFGVWTVIDGIRLRRGTYRSWFYVHRTPTVIMPNMMFGAIPAGLGMLACGIALLGRHFGWLSEKIGMLVLTGVGFPLFGLSAIFWVFKPRFVQPDWYRWLNDNYGTIMHSLQKDAVRLGEWWLERTGTQEGLEQWAEEVRQRHEAGTQ